MILRRGFQILNFKPRPLRSDPIPTDSPARPILSGCHLLSYGRTISLQGRWQPRHCRLTPCAHRHCCAPTRTSLLLSTPPPLPSLLPWLTRSSSLLHDVSGNAMHLLSSLCASESAAAFVAVVVAAVVVAAAARGCHCDRPRRGSHCQVAPSHRLTKSSPSLHAMTGDAMNFSLSSCAGEFSASVPAATVRGCHLCRRRCGSHWQVAPVLLSCPLRKLHFCGRALVLQRRCRPEVAPSLLSLLVVVLPLFISFACY